MRPNPTESVANARLGVDNARLVIAMIGMIQSGRTTPPLDRAILVKTILEYARTSGLPLDKK